MLYGDIVCTHTWRDLDFIFTFKIEFFIIILFYQKVPLLILIPHSCFYVNFLCNQDLEGKETWGFSRVSK